MKPIVLLILISLAIPQAFYAQEPAAQKPDGPVVELSLIVTDKDRESLKTISKDEVRIVEDKVEQTVLSVERDNRPIDYAVLIDSSNSLRRLLAAAVEAARLIVTNRRGTDEIFIESFVSSDKIDTLHEFSTDTNSMLESLKKIRIEGGQSAVVDALYLGAQHVAEHNKAVPNRRKALVLISDGEDRNSYYEFKQLLTLLREKKIQVFAIGLVIDLDETTGFIQKSPREKAQKLLNTITEETGGRVFYPKTPSELLKATAEVILDLRSQFRVTYQSPPNGKKGFRKVDVKLISPNGERREATAPRGYYVDGPSKSKEQKSQ